MLGWRRWQTPRQVDGRHQVNGKKPEIVMFGWLLQEAYPATMDVNRMNDHDTSQGSKYTHYLVKKSSITV